MSNADVMSARNFSTEIRAAEAEAADQWRAVYKVPPSERYQTRVRCNAAYQRLHDLRREMAETFAALNGWRESKSYFGTATLARGGVHSRDPYGRSDPLEPCGEAFDHPVHFRERERPFRSAAIVGQPYSHATLEMGRAIAAHLGLELHTPPNLNASWHAPGDRGTRFFVFTRPGTPVRFLPEQERATP